MPPRYRRVVDFARARGVKWFCLDSDGKIDSLMPVWLDAGIDILYPFEVQAGMDVLSLRQRFGRDLRMWGGVDKRALLHGRAEIDAELDRLRDAHRGGRLRADARPQRAARHLVRELLLLHGTAESGALRAVKTARRAARRPSSAPPRMAGPGGSATHRPA